MNKEKKKLVIILIIALAILLILITFFIIDNNRVKSGKEPMFIIERAIKDHIYGSTKVYKGIGYKILIHESMYDKKIEIGTILMKEDFPFGEEYYKSFIGTIIEVEELDLLVKPDRDENIFNVADVISVTGLESETYAIGDKVKVIYNGEVLESYPAKVDVVYIENI